VLLAHAWPEIRDSYLRRHPPEPRTANTICERAALDAELEQIRARGYALDDEEFLEGVSCLAAPILERGSIVAALGLSVPTERFRVTRTELLATLQQVAAGVEAGEFDTDADEDGP
jgi:IclR family acetate operon transcriptional repressor